jgi:hypothetical protein
VNTTEAALSALKDFWLSNGSMTAEQERRLRRAWRKLLVDSAKFFRTAKPAQQEELRKLRRFYVHATCGSALSTSFRRTRVALFLKDWELFDRRDEPIQNVDSLTFLNTANEYNLARRFVETESLEALRDLRYLWVLWPILRALRSHDHEFFSDLAIAIRFTKIQSRSNAFLAEYSLLMLGKQPVLTFAELERMLDIHPRELRSKIKELRDEYGPLVAPLKPGKPGRPPKKIER